MTTLNSLLTAPAQANNYASLGPLKGCNLGGCDYGAFPSTGTIDYLVGIGCKVLRVPIKMERIISAPGAALNSAYAAQVKAVTDYIAGKEVSFVLDLHNYCDYQIGATVPSAPGADISGGNKVIIGEDVQFTAAQFADLWTKLVQVFECPKAIWGLMNEPGGSDELAWIATAQAAVNAIRAAGSTNPIFVMTNGVETSTAGQTGFAAWGFSNSMTLMRRLTDPMNDLIFEVHQYYDANGEGKSDQCNIGSGRRIKPFLDYCRRYGYRCFIGEFGGGANATCQTEVGTMLALTDQYRDVVLGWTWWYAIENQWGYPYQLLPDSLGAPITPKPQLAWLTPFLQD